MKRTTLAAATLAVAAGLVAGGGAASAAGHAGGAGTHSAHVSVFATGFNNPRGLVFGPNGDLFVAEGGLGGSHSTVGKCRQASGAAAPYTGSSGNPVLGGRISRVTPGGVRSVVVRGLPSSQTAPALGSLVSGVSSVAFVGHHLYALLAGAGCSHGVPNVPNGVIRVGHHGNWSLIANLSRFQRTHPVAQPEADDFEPDGTWFSMIAVGRALYPMDSNHGELDRVTPNGRIRRVLDISARLGHVVPTALVNHHGRFSFGNLGLFGAADGTTPNEHVWDITGRGHVKGRASGIEQVLGLAFRQGRLYALEMSTTPGGPTPGTGALVRLHDGRPVQTIASGLDFPTGVTVGPDGAFYVSDRGFGFGVGQGRILRIVP